MPLNTSLPPSELSSEPPCLPRNRGTAPSLPTRKTTAHMCMAQSIEKRRLTIVREFAALPLLHSYPPARSSRFLTLETTYSVLYTNGRHACRQANTNVFRVTYIRCSFVGPRKLTLKA